MANMIKDLEYVTISRSFPAFVNPVKGGDFKVNPRPVPGGGWNDHFWHINAERTKTEPMKQDEIYDIKFTATPETGEAEPTALKLGTRAIHERTLLFSMQVAFVGEKPTKIWKYERVGYFSIPNEANEYNTIELDERGVARMQLRDVYGGLFSGIGWSW